jgi:hypothetical protein
MARQPTPQEKQVYDKMVRMALGFLFTEKTAGMIKQMVGSADPADVVPSIVAQLMKQMIEAAKIAGKDVMMYHKHVAKEVTAHLIDMLINFKVVQKAQAPQLMQASMAAYADITGAK